MDQAGENMLARDDARIWQGRSGDETSHCLGGADGLFPASPGAPDYCPVCGTHLTIEPSVPAGDAHAPLRQPGFWFFRGQASATYWASSRYPFARNR